MWGTTRLTGSGKKCGGPDAAALRQRLLGRALATCRALLPAGRDAVADGRQGEMAGGTRLGGAVVRARVRIYNGWADASKGRGSGGRDAGAGRVRRATSRARGASSRRRSSRSTPSRSGWLPSSSRARTGSLSGRGSCWPRRAPITGALSPIPRARSLTHTRCRRSGARSASFVSATSRRICVSMPSAFR